MECSFEVRKQQLLRDCQVEAGQFAQSLERLQEFIVPFVQSFRRQDQRDYATLVAQGLCSDLSHKNAESIAYLFHLDRKTIQHFLGESHWDDQPLRAQLAQQIGNQLGTPDGVLAFDPSSFPKSGRQSVGVQRQWCGRLGKVENCQVGIYLAYVSRHGHALVDGELYLPKEWTQDKARMKKAGIPKAQQKYRTRHTICLELLAKHGAALPHQWITGDDELGRPVQFRRDLAALGEQYLLAVPCNTNFTDEELEPPPHVSCGPPPVRPNVRADHWAATQPDSAWTQIDVRDAEKGPLIVELLKRRVKTGKRSHGGVAREMLVAIRYRARDAVIVKQDYYLSNAAAETSLAEFARVAKAAHRVEECFDRGKGEAGLGDYEVRNWVGWQHHQTLSLLASWFLNVETRRAEKKDTGDHVQPSAVVPGRLDPPRMPLRPGCRFRPLRHAAIRAQSTCQVVSLQTPQMLASPKLGSS